MSSPLSPPEIAPPDSSRLAARQAHLGRELSRTAARRPLRRGLVRAGAVIALAVVAGAVALTGRGGQPDAVARALAAVSRGPYLGIVVRFDHAGHSTLVHLDTHTAELVRPRSELWFDTRKHGRAADVGGCTRLVGPHTHSACVGAILTGLPALFTGAIDHYRAALASGQVKRTSSGVVRGRSVWWLRVASGAFPPYARTIRVLVAVDQKTGNPLRIETRRGARVIDGEDVDVIAETADLPAYVRAAARFPRVPPLLGQRRHHAATVVTLAEAARAVPGALWPGRSAAGEPFRRARVITLADGLKQLELLYGGACPAHCVLVKQSPGRAGWAPGSRLYGLLPDRTVVVNGGRYGDGRSGKIAIRLEGTDKAAILATALALRPLAP